MPGEKTWPTQPFPTKPPPFARQKFTVDDLSPYLEPGDRARFRDEILSARNEGLYTPPGKRPTIQMPGNNGGANWSGAAVDPASGFLGADEGRAYFLLYDPKVESGATFDLKWLKARMRDSTSRAP